MKLSELLVSDKAGPVFRPLFKAQNGRLTAIHLLKGEVIKALNNNSLATCAFSENLSHSTENSEEGADEITSLSSEVEATCPERLTYRTQLRLVCSQALQALSQVEQKVIVESHLKEEPMEDIATRLGYSRGHLFAIRKIAERKMRHHMDDFNLAA